MSANKRQPVQDDLVALVEHYSRVTDGLSALSESVFDELCIKHAISPERLSHAFAREVAERFVAGRLTFDAGDFAMNDLFWASRCSLTGFSLEVFHAFEDGEVMDPRYPPGTVPWQDYTLPGVREALARDDSPREPEGGSTAIPG